MVPNRKADITSFVPKCETIFAPHFEEDDELVCHCLQNLAKAIRSHRGALTADDLWAVRRYYYRWLHCAAVISEDHKDVALMIVYYVIQYATKLISFPKIKEAIINNSDIKILLDQSKFKDRYGEISAILGLTDVQKQQIFTINSLPNHEGRNYFKKVWICRGQYSDVYGVEESPECYWAYTTERAEKEALKVYERQYGDIQTAITRIEEDRKAMHIGKYLDFAVMVNKQGKVMPL